MNTKKKGGEADIMSTIKPIQATPELSGEDAARLLVQVEKKPTKQTIKRNKMLSSVLRNIRTE